MSYTIPDIAVAKQIGSYSDAVEASPNLRWLMTSGTPGFTDASKVPTDITSQSELAWENVLRVLSKADMTVHDIVKVTQYLTRAEDIQTYSQVRNRFLGAARPAAMLLVIPQLVWPNLFVEVEIIAAKAD
jgi:2-iminobutanoate/2-iminopropanoate deaminase